MRGKMCVSIEGKQKKGVDRVKDKEGCLGGER